MPGIATATLERSSWGHRRESGGPDRFLSDASSEVVWSGAVGGGGLTVSGSVKRHCGFTPAEILAAPGNIWFDRAHPDDFLRMEDAYRVLVVTGAPLDAEYRWQHQDGSWRWLRVRASLRAAGAPIVDAVLVDITPQKRLEDQFYQLQKMDAVGQFTSGIAHDFNNLLAVILANASFLVEALPPGDPRRADADAIAAATESAAALTRQLLTFSRHRAFAPKPIDINRIVTAAEHMLRRVLGDDVELSMDLAPGLGRVHADPGLIGQVLMNLVINARDAMPEGGKLSIRTSMLTPGQSPSREPGPVRATVNVRLAVSDTGCGMDSATRRRIFEPFFTTKSQARGTGLGLSTCFDIVRRAGGQIRVESEPGIGSEFEVLLPLTSAELDAAVPKAVAATDDGHGTETILVVEDDASVRRLVETMLRRKGYRVFGAACGQDALAILHSTDGPIDLVLCDVVMPDLGGGELVSRVQTRSRRTRALFMSGHTTDSLLDHGTLRDTDSFIPKPFTALALAVKIREVLDA